MQNFSPVPDSVPLEQVRRTLVIKLRHHGDVLLTSPVFSVLKNAAPAMEIDALVYSDTADMLSLHPSISRLHCIDRAWKNLGVLAQARAEWELFCSLKSRRYDLVLHLTEHWRGAWLARLLKPCWAVGYVKAGGKKRWKESFTHLVPWPRAGGRHTVESNLDALRRIGLQPEPAERATSLAEGEAAIAKVSARLAEKGLNRDGFVHLHPASRWFFKCWTAAGWAEVVGRLQGAGWPVVLTAAPDAAEHAMVADIQARLAVPAVNFAGEFNLKELAALTRQARLFVGVDSAPMHIAAAVGTPAVAVFGPSGANLWGPWGQPRHHSHAVVASQVHSCRPCGLDGCGGGKVSDCLTTLPVEAVWEPVAARLGLSP